MDPRERADAVLARAQARGVFVVTPDSATSPMDSANTQQIPRAKITELDRGQDPDTTAQLPASLIEENDHPLAGAAPTRQLDAPNGRRQQTTTPLPTAQVTAPLTRRPQAKPIASPLKEQATKPEPKPKPQPKPRQDPEDTGLVPTVTKNNGKSNLSRRLDGI
jgi:hypothetical protein